MGYSAVAQFIIYFTFLSILLCISIWDIKKRTIPNTLNLGILILGIFSYMILPDEKFSYKIIGTLIISVPMLICTLIKPASIGGGDIKMMAASGCLLGGHRIIVSFCVAIIFASIYIIFASLFKKVGKYNIIPLGPFLSMGCVIGMLYGDRIIAWYLNS